MNVSKLKIAELKKELKERGLPTTGNKGDLAARLREALQTEGTETAPADDDLEAKESELLGEEEEEDTNAEELDTKLLEPAAVPPAAAAAAKPKKIVINRDSAESAQQAAAAASQAAELAAAAAAKTPGAPAAALTADSDQPAKKRIKLSDISQMDRLSLRASKFASGDVKVSSTLSEVRILTAEERRAARLAKFGTAPVKPPSPPRTTSPTPDPTSELGKLKKRAERFGEAVSGKVKELDEAERLKRRRERFGIVTPEQAKARRAAKFGTSAGVTTSTSVTTTDSKKLARAARFGLAT